ncbi:hypothetical protein K6Q96_06810 [Grimontia kaedaensis]|uniref:Uncharacterized protein n=1 Tax=Grimontia kaedaensis TaxID=2872157 RepID=A0ABY4WXI1_9GAMM|nr:hypothetical protein [Grimontia kaedaensis]USH03697.1 hypothetical protein K6Q96_06810 [Grimontia kaedaensis]
MYRLIFFGIIAFILLIAAVFKTFTASVFTGGSLFLTAILVISWGCSDFVSMKENVSSSLIFGAIGLLGLKAALDSSNLTKDGYLEKNYDIVYDARFIRNCTEQQQPDDSLRAQFNREKDNLLWRCATQDLRDLNALHFEFMKTRMLDPFTGAVDAMTGVFVIDEKMSCQEFARALKTMCPGSFDY